MKEKLIFKATFMFDSWGKCALVSKSLDFRVHMNTKWFAHLPEQIFLIN